MGHATFKNKSSGPVFHNQNQLQPDNFNIELVKLSDLLSPWPLKLSNFLFNVIQHQHEDQQAAEISPYLDPTWTTNVTDNGAQSTPYFIIVT